MLGERLFPLIQAMHRDLAGKITGMLLEIDNSELIHMLESGESLRAKVGGSEHLCFDVGINVIVNQQFVNVAKIAKLFRSPQ